MDMWIYIHIYVYKSLPICVCVCISLSICKQNICNLLYFDYIPIRLLIANKNQTMTPLYTHRFDKNKYQVLVRIWKKMNFHTCGKIKWYKHFPGQFDNT